MSVAASTHLYGADGRFLGYRLEEASVEGETIPSSRLRRMFPPEAYAEKRVVIHRDGPFRGEEINTFRDLEQEMDSTFHLVAVRKQGAPRLYGLQDGSAAQAPKGGYVRESDRVAHVVSSPPPFEGSTPRPLQVHVRSDSLSIEEALHSVLSFSLMHHGSVRPPRLPVSLHYSDSVASRLQDGIRPRNQKGKLPYWL
jgi:argonaute-like protein implicated in RNA metabolism and viral defense